MERATVEARKIPRTVAPCFHAERLFAPGMSGLSPVLRHARPYFGPQKGAMLENPIGNDGPDRPSLAQTPIETPSEMHDAVM
jgi:hypothetical protein